MLGGENKVDTIKFNKMSTQVIAHRGLSGIETENTNSAFVAAGNRTYFGIETDIHVTLDGKFIVIHDRETTRVCDTVVNVEETTFEDLRKLRLNNICKYDAEGICENDVRGDILLPALAEYIGICRKYKKKSVLELKGRFQIKDLKKLVDEISALNYIEDVIFISFNLDNLIDLREIYQDAQIQYLVSSYDSEVLKTMNTYNFDLDIDYRGLTKEIIEEVHQNGHIVNCWTVDDVENALQLVEWGIDYITSNILE